MMIDVSIATVYSEVYFDYFLSFFRLFSGFPPSFVRTRYPSKNRPGIPVESRWNSSPDFPGIPGRCRADSAGIPLESAGIIAGIPPVFPWNSGHFQLEFRRIIAGIPPVFKWNCSRNSTGIIAGIPPVFHWNSSQNSAGIIAGIPLVFHWNSSRNSARIIAGIPPEFGWNYCRHTAGIPDNSSWNSTRIPDPKTAGIPELG